VLCRLSRCANIITGGEGPLPRVKPFKYTYEKEIVMYAYFKKLDYFSTECVYAPFAARGFARDFVKDLEVRPRASSKCSISPGRQSSRGRISQGLQPSKGGINLGLQSSRGGISQGSAVLQERSQHVPAAP